MVVGAFFFCAGLFGGCTTERPVPQAKDTLVIGMPEGYAAAGDIGIQDIARILSREGLTQLSPDGRVEPRLIQSWQWENNGLALRARVQKGVFFHDGQRLTAQFVAGMLRDAVSREANRALYSSFNYVTSVTAEDDYTLLIRLSEPSVFLPEDLEIPLQKGSPPISTGPFRIVNSSRSEVVLERFDKYRLGLPTVRRIVLRPIPTLRTAWTELLRGSLDMVTDVPPDAVEFITNDDVQVMSFLRRYQYVLVLNNRRPVLHSPLVRRALNLAVDRQGVVQRVLRGKGLASTGPFSPRYWAYDPSVGGYGYDPTAAEALLDQAGFHRGAAPSSAGRPPARLRFTCLVPAGFAVWERVALEIQRSLYAVGVDMEFVVVPFDQFDREMRSGNIDAAIVDMISGPTPARAFIFWRSEHAQHGLNVFGYENPEAERLFDTLRRSANEASTRAATRRLQRVFLDDPPAVFIAWNERARAIRRPFDIDSDPGRDPVAAVWRAKPAVAPPLMRTAAVQ